MFFKRRYLLILAIAFFLVENCSTSIRVYRPYPHETPYEVIQTFPKISIVSAHPFPDRFAYYSPYIYTTKGLPLVGVEYDLLNEYGSLPYLIRKEFSVRPTNYPLLLKEGGKIEIREFEFESVDGCFSNIARIKLKIEVQIGKNKVDTFEYSDQINSHVTDCFLTGSIITIIPLVWYTPYVGYRGNREDQLNQLGRNAIESFFSFLEAQNGFTGNSIKPPNKTSPPPRDPVRDPKVKEIMEDL